LRHQTFTWTPKYPLYGSEHCLKGICLITQTRDLTLTSSCSLNSIDIPQCARCPTPFFSGFCFRCFRCVSFLPLYFLFPLLFIDVPPFSFFMPWTPRCNRSPPFPVTEVSNVLQKRPVKEHLASGGRARFPLFFFITLSLMTFWMKTQILIFFLFSPVPTRVRRRFAWNSFFTLLPIFSLSSVVSHSPSLSFFY